jgi:DNA-binding beta-propeller fold protein YncE
VDTAGNVFVADYFNFTIRKVTPAGEVTTLAGMAGSPGSANGTGNNARFNYPAGVAVDSAGNVYVADQDNSTIRKVTPEGVVTTLAGLAGSAGSANGTNRAARFSGPQGVAVDSAGNLAPSAPRAPTDPYVKYSLIRFVSTRREAGDPGRSQPRRMTHCCP